MTDNWPLPQLQRDQHGCLSTLRILLSEKNIQKITLILQQQKHNLNSDMFQTLSSVGILG